MDASQYSSIELLATEIKKGLTLSNLHDKVDHHSFLSPSPYDTAWLAMVPIPDGSDRPMFESCLEWVLENQRQEGFWSEFYDEHELDRVRSIECLTSTLACLVALKRWNAGAKSIDKGLRFLHENTEKILTRADSDGHKNLPRWFTIMFPAMLELARSHGLPVTFDGTVSGSIINKLFQNQQQILKREGIMDQDQYLPLLAYLETLPQWYEFHEEDITRNLGDDGSLFRSPSAMARAYMATGNLECLAYLQSLTQNFPNNGVPTFYPVDEELIKLITVNQIMRLGLAEHFVDEIDAILTQIHWNYKDKIMQAEPTGFISARLYKDSLAFWLLRLNGYDVSPSMFCWFLSDKSVRNHIGDNYGDYATVLLNIYGATELMFPGEPDLEEARSFSRNYLEKIVNHQGEIYSPILRRSIERELNIPWAARMDHLEHRMWMEDIDANSIWMGKFSILSQNNELLQLAAENYTYRQLVYRNELEVAKRWAKKTGLCEMGFGREKTTYCYFACAASSSFIFPSSVRLMIVKSAIIITVADDFYDTKGSMEELEQLTNAVLSWDGRGLHGHAKTIYRALDDLVSDITKECLIQNLNDKSDLQDLWYETFHSWLMEAKWAKGTVNPSMDEYIQNAMISIAAHTLVLPAAYFSSPNTPNHRLIMSRPYHDITNSLMLTTRLLNDVQSYSKEEMEGKVNLVWVHLNDNPSNKLEDSIQHVQNILNDSKKELLQHVLTTSYDLPNAAWKQLHLSCFKVFHMFFDASNRYDSDSELLHDIEKALVLPPRVQTLNEVEPAETQPLMPSTLLPPHQYRPGQRKEKIEISSRCYDPSIVRTQARRKIMYVQHQMPMNSRLDKRSAGFASVWSSMKSCFI